MTERQPKRSYLKAAVLVFAGFACLAFHEAIGQSFFAGYKLGLGSTIPNDDRTRFTFFYAYWVVFGTGAVIFLTTGLCRLTAGSRLRERFEGWWRTSSGFSWVVAFSILTIALAVVIRLFVLHRAPMVDDEWSYRFAAQTLASGHLTANSLPEPLKLFFDRHQMINDGRWYSQYFLGWPALMAPGVWLGIEEWMNAFYAALTIPAVYLTVGRLVGEGWAKLSVVLVTTSPFLMVQAATLGSHTTCMMAAAWSLYFYLRAAGSESHWGWHAGFALAFSCAFFIRPYTALSLSLPFLGVWFYLVVVQGTVRWKALAAFAFPAAVMAFLFLAVNTAQNGGPFQTAYGAYQSYIEANGHRITLLDPETSPLIANLRFDEPLKRIALVGVGVFRLNRALFGWPASLVLILAAPLDRRTSLLWGSMVTYLGLHLFVNDPGADAYGPLHFFELSLPVIILSVAGAKRLSEFASHLDGGIQRGDESGASSWRAWPAVAVGTAIAIAFFGYHPVRLGTVAKMGVNISLPEKSVERAELEDAIVFAPKSYAPPCLVEPATYSVTSRPSNHPNLEGSVLWANHISVQDDKKLMRYFPGRRGYVLMWPRQRCSPDLLPLQRLRPGMLPERDLGDSGEGPDWSRAPDPGKFSPYERRY